MVPLGVFGLGLLKQAPRAHLSGTQTETPVHRLLFLCHDPALCLGLMLYTFSHPIICPRLRKTFSASFFLAFPRPSAALCWVLLVPADLQSSWSLWGLEQSAQCKKNPGELQYTWWTKDPDVAAKEQRSEEVPPPTTKATWAANTSCSWNLNSEFGKGWKKK